MKNKHHFEYATKRKYEYPNSRTNQLNLYMNILLNIYLYRLLYQ